ncbi:MAG: M56 family metallopeptidase, partial [Planctomycetota bacterium]
MNEVGIALVWCAVQVTLIGLLAAAIYTVARRIGPAAGSLVVITSLLVIVALSALALSPWPHWPVALSAASPDRQSAQAQREATPAATDGSDNATSAGRAGSEQAAGPPDLPEASQATPTAVFWQALLDELSTVSAESEAPQRQWTTIAAILFLVAVGAGFLWVLIGLVAVRSCRLRSRPVRDAGLLELVDLLSAELGCRRPIEVRQTQGLVTATTFGWRRPVVLLPAEWTNWTQAERRAVLAHEIAHIRHHDFLACLGGQLGLALHFYHPLVHWLTGRLRLEQELAADATAATLAGGRGSYLKTLAEIALRQEDRFVAWPARTFLPTRNTFLRRIQMLRHSKQRSTSLSLAARVLTVGTLVLLGLIVSGLRSPARDPAALAGEAPQADTARAVENTPLDLSLVSTEAVGLVSIRPGEILRRPDFRKLAGLLNKEIEHEMDLPLEKIEEITWVGLAFAPPAGTPARPWTPFDAFVAWVLPFDAGYLIVRTSDPKDSRSTTELVTKNPRRQRFGEQTYYLSRATT